MADLQSYNTAQANSAKNWLVPSWGQMFIYFLCGFFLLVILNARALWTYFNGSVGVSPDTALSVVRDPFNRFSDFTDGLFRGRLAPILVWAFLGVMTYMVIWLIQSAITNVHNDLAAEQYKHPLTYKRDHYWWSVAGDKVFLVCSVLVFGLFVYLGFSVLLPVMAKLFYAGIYNWQFTESITRLLGSVLFTSFLLYVFLLLAHTVRNSWRWVTTNL